MGPTDESFICQDFIISQVGLTSATIHYEEDQRITGIQLFWESNTQVDNADDLDTMIGVESDLEETVSFTETDVFFGFVGSYDANEIKSLVFLVQDPACSIIIEDDETG